MAGYIGTQPVPQATQTRDSFTCTAGQTSFATGGYTPTFLDVYLNGIFLANGADYTAANGSDVILTAGAAAGDILEVVAYTSFEVVNDTVTNAGTVLNLDRTGSDGTILDLKKDGTTVGSIGSSNGDLMLGNSDVGLKFHDANNTIYPWNVSSDAASDGQLDLGAGAIRFKDLYLSGGVYLGGTGSANKLDGYEEGTWTPVLSSGTAAATYNKYTKIGDQVIATLYMTGFSDTTSSTGVSITGLPFTSNQYVMGSVSLYRYILTGNGGDHLAIYGGASGTGFTLYTCKNGTGNYEQVVHNDFTSSSANIFLTIIYKTSS